MRRTDPENTRKSYFRTGNRIFSLNGQWFFATREGDMGPFPSREAAAREVTRFVREHRDLERLQRAKEIQFASGSEGLALVPKDDEPELTLDDLMIIESRR